jgi:transposase-like protein
MKKRRTYTDAEKAEVLAVLRANGGNVRKTSQMTGVPRRSISYFVDGAKTPVPQALVEEKCVKLADKLDHIADMLADRLTDPEKLAKANLQQVAVTELAEQGQEIDRKKAIEYLAVHMPEISQHVN